MSLTDKLAPVGAGTDGSVPARLAAQAPLAVSVLLVLGLAAQAATIVWSVLAPPAPAAAAAPADVPAAAPPVDVAAILAGRLFGGGADGAVSADAVAASTQNLVLAGTIAGRDPEQGWAILGDSAQSARVYGTGASVPGGARLKAVYPDRVILDVNGRLEALMLPRLSGAAGPMPASLPAAAAPPPAVDGSLADRMRQLAQDQPNLLSQVMRPQPVFAGGQQRGYRVYPGRDRQQFAKLGLQPGDLVTAVNGTPLDDPARGMDILKNLSAGDRVTITVERNGQQQQLNVDASRIAAEVAEPGQGAQAAPAQQE